jgi:hypothetical protein
MSAPIELALEDLAPSGQRARRAFGESPLAPPEAHRVQRPPAAAGDFDTAWRPADGASCGGLWDPADQRRAARNDLPTLPWMPGRTGSPRTWIARPSTSASRPWTRPQPHGGYHGGPRANPHFRYLVDRRSRQTSSPLQPDDPVLPRFADLPVWFAERGQVVCSLPLPQAQRR